MKLTALKVVDVSRKLMGGGQKLIPKVLDSCTHLPQAGEAKLWPFKWMVGLSHGRRLIFLSGHFSLQAGSMPSFLRLDATGDSQRSANAFYSICVWTRYIVGMEDKSIIGRSRLRHKNLFSLTFNVALKGYLDGYL